MAKQNATNGTNGSSANIGFESELWRAADALRSNMDAAEYMQVLIKRILRKYGYPPDKQEKATQTVLEQAEALSRAWTEAAP